MRILCSEVPHVLLCFWDSTFSKLFHFGVYLNSGLYCSSSKMHGLRHKIPFSIIFTAKTDSCQGFVCAVGISSIWLWGSYIQPRWNVWIQLRLLMALVRLARPLLCLTVPRHNISVWYWPKYQKPVQFSLPVLLPWFFPSYASPSSNKQPFNVFSVNRDSFASTLRDILVLAIKIFYSSFL